MLIEWREIDGPFVAGKPERTGFGTVLTEISIRDQMGGRLTREWDESGLRVIAIVPRANLLRGRP